MHGPKFLALLLGIRHPRSTDLSFYLSTIQCIAAGMDHELFEALRGAADYVIWNAFPSIVINATKYSRERKTTATLHNHFTCLGANFNSYAFIYCFVLEHGTRKRIPLVELGNIVSQIL